jgi:hypothetical protein
MPRPDYILLEKIENHELDAATQVEEGLPTEATSDLAAQEANHLAEGTPGKSEHPFSTFWHYLSFSPLTSFRARGSCPDFS